MRPVPDRFFAAVRALTADEPAKQRLITAYVDHLETLHADDVPESIRPRFESLRKAMNSVAPTERETAVQVSVRKMSPADAQQIRDKIGSSGYAGSVSMDVALRITGVQPAPGGGTITTEVLEYELREDRSGAKLGRVEVAQ